MGEIKNIENLSLPPVAQHNNDLAKNLAHGFRLSQCIVKLLMSLIYISQHQRAQIKK